MTKVLLITQDKGGVGKSLATRGLAEVVPGSPVIEVDASPRLLELGKRAKFFKTRAEGRKNLGKDPAPKAAEPKAPAAASDAPAAASDAPALSAKVSYVITLNGQEHRVTVAPKN